MENKKLILKFKEKEETYNFVEKVNTITDSKLIKILRRENIKNTNSTLRIDSLNLPIFEVIQFKVNVSEVGSFIFNFEKDKINDQIREEILSKITKLHDDVKPTKEIQINKVKNLFNILFNYEEIYCAYDPCGEYKLDANDLTNFLCDVHIKFPILLLDDKEDSYLVESNNLGFKKFSVDYLFTSIFSMLMAFGVLTGVFEIFNKQSISAFLLVIAFVFFSVLCYSVYSLIYKHKQEINKNLKYFLLIYTTIGIVVGLIIGYLVCKFVLKFEVENLSIKNILLISTGVSLILSIASIFIPKLINLITRKK